MGDNVRLSILCVGFKNRLEKENCENVKGDNLELNDAR